MQDAGGGGGAGNAGPQERKLIQAFSANLETLDVSVSSWSSGATMLQNVARRLGQQADQLETTFGKDNPTGMAAAQRYREVQAKVTKRESEMRTASQALAHTRAGLVAAQDDYGKLPPVTTNPDAPQTDLERLMDPGGTLKKAAYDSERQQREAAASAALARLDTHFEKSAEDLRTVAGDRPTDRSSGGGGGETRAAAPPRSATGPARPPSRGCPPAPVAVTRATPARPTAAGTRARVTPARPPAARTTPAPRRAATPAAVSPAGAATTSRPPAPPVVTPAGRPPPRRPGPAPPRPRPSARARSPVPVPSPPPAGVSPGCAPWPPPARVPARSGARRRRPPAARSDAPAR